MTSTAVSKIERQAPAVAPELTGADLAANLDAYARHAAGALSGNTERALRSDIRIFTAWCADNGRDPLPADPETVAGFIDAKAAERAPATVRRYMASIAAFHRAAGAVDPTKAEPPRLALKRMARSAAKDGRGRQRQAKPLRSRDVERMIARAGDRPADLRNVALILTARDMIARRSEVVALDIEDITLEDDGTGRALLRQSKTDQEGEGTVLFLSADTMAALDAWCAAAGLRSGALFRTVNKAGRPGKRLSADAVADIFRRMASAAGIDPTGFSGHSARVGMAQDLLADGADLASLMQAARWKSPRMAMRYTEALAAGSGAVARYHARRGA